MSEYHPTDYDAMFADPVRSAAYQRAIADVVGPDDVVVEIGTGVGYFAVAACRAGARAVYAIDIDPSVLLAERLVRENDCDRRVTCIHGDANRITLPERGTVMISDLRGVLPFRADAIRTIASARSRLLVPGARLIPATDTIWAAPCAAPSGWAQLMAADGTASAGIRRASLADHARSVVHRVQMDVAALCGEPARVATVDYSSIMSPNVDADIALTITRDAEVEGLVLWFDAQLAPGVSFTTSPAAPRTMYGHAFVPFERATPASVGDLLRCRLRFRTVDARTVLAWDTTLHPTGSAVPTVTMRQSTLNSLLVSPAELRRRTASYRPDPALFESIRELLSLMDGERSLGEVAAELVRRHPEHFDDEVDALAWVTRRSGTLDDLAAW